MSLKNREVERLYTNMDKQKTSNEIGFTAKGFFKKYANPNLMEKEKSAWAEVVREKHGNSGKQDR